MTASLCAAVVVTVSAALILTDMIDGARRGYRGQPIPFDVKQDGVLMHAVTITYTRAALSIVRDVFTVTAIVLYFVE